MLNFLLSFFALTDILEKSNVQDSIVLYYLRDGKVERERSTVFALSLHLFTVPYKRLHGEFKRIIPLNIARAFTKCWH